MKKFFKKHWQLVFVVASNIILLVLQPHREVSVLYFTGQNLINFLFMLTPVFVCIGLMDRWMERDIMVKIMGENSGRKGMITALLMGMVTAVPLYALLPVAKVLLKKDCKIFNVLLFLCASASIRIPLLLFELSSFGWLFAFLRFGLNVLVVIAIAVMVEKQLTDQDKKIIYDNVKNNAV